MSKTMIKSYGFRPVKLDSNKVRIKIGKLRNRVKKGLNKIDKNNSNTCIEWVDLNGQIKAFNEVLELFADDTMEDMI